MHHNGMFAGSDFGTVGTELALHAGHQLYGKAFRYLKRVIVTPSLHRRLAPLDRSLTYRQWEGLRSYTSPCGLATPCVFIKQSGSSCHCALLFPKDSRDPFSRSYGANLPSSLKSVFSLHALGYSPRGTSVGSRYDLKGSFLISFSRTPGIGRTHIREPITPSSASHYYSTPQSYHAWTGRQSCPT